MKLSQKVKDIFDIVRAVSSFITIFAVGFALFFTYAISEVEITTIPNFALVLLKIFAVILVLFPFILYPKLATVFPQELIAKLISIFRFFRVYQQIN